MKPSRVLAIYYVASFTTGLLLTVLTAYLLTINELGARGAALMTLCWNVLFVLILPLVLDWSERKHFKARFIKLEEVAASNPELAAALSDQCEKLSLPKLRLAVVDAPGEEVFGYGLWGSNPRLVVTGAVLNEHEQAHVLPSIEAVLTGVKTQDHTMVFVLFSVFQIVLQHIFVVLL